MDMNAARDVREKLKQYTGIIYSNDVISAARVAYLSGDTKATWPEEMPPHIDGREEDKTGSWMLI